MQAEKSEQSNTGLAVELPKALSFSFVVIATDGFKTITSHLIRTIEVKDEPPHITDLSKAITEAINQALTALPNSHVISFSHARLN